MRKNLVLQLKQRERLQILFPQSVTGMLFIFSLRMEKQMCRQEYIRVIYLSLPHLTRIMPPGLRRKTIIPDKEMTTLVIPPSHPRPAKWAPSCHRMTKQMLPSIMQEGWVKVLSISRSTTGSVSSAMPRFLWVPTRKSPAICLFRCTRQTTIFFSPRLVPEVIRTEIR